MNLPYLTTEFPGIGGVIKQRNEDFFVQEIPLSEPSGEGEQVYFEIQQIGLTPFEAMHRIATALNVPTREIGYAGLKDARAISRQVFSIAGVTEAELMSLKIDRITIQWAARHGNKLRLGHLAGNRFAIKIREVNPTDVVKLKKPLEMLQQRGVPNFFGEQRFGRRANNHLVGAALVRGDNQQVLQLLLGDPRPDIDGAHELKAREFFAKRENEESMKAWPRHCGMERRVLARLIKAKKPNAAVRIIDEKLRRLWVSALQSQMFNSVLAQRITTLDQVMLGDLAYKHDNGACFHVEDPAVEQPRATAFEISPTGPLLGYRMSAPTGEPGTIEQAVFDENHISPKDFRNDGIDRVKGARRPLRVQPKDVEISAGVDETGPHITTAFSLPAGSFATILLRELMKTPDPEESSAETEEEDAPVTDPA
ncbi:tRNA pseudouridine(13) synthase TruD [soil metagenome]